MRIERTINAGRNILYGGVLKVYSLVVPFLMRTAMIYLLGMQYVGLNTLFTSILSVLSLAELGVGGAMVYSMYRPIAEDNTEEICALMSLYRLYYRIIGLVIAVAGGAVIPFLPKLIKVDTVPEGVNIYILYVINLVTVVISYWLYSYKNSLLTAHQRSDISSKVSMIVSTVTYAVQFAVLYFFRNYYFYVTVAMVMGVVTNLATAVVVDRMYPNYRAKGKLPKAMIHQINHRVRDLFTAKIGTVVVNSADTIVISAFLGLTSLALYQNYFFVVSSIMGFITICFSACTAGIGNSIVTETPEKNYNDLRKFTLFVIWISCVCSCCFLCLFQPFITLWVGEENTLSFSVVICFVVYFFIMEINQLLNLYKDAAGMWHEDRFRPLITALANLILNLIMVQKAGLYGIILSTVLSTLIIGMPWLIHNIFNVIFPKIYLIQFMRELVKYIMTSIIICCITFFVNAGINLSPVLTLVVRGMICCILSNLLLWCAFHKDTQFGECVALLDNMTKGKLGLKRILK